MCNTGESKWVIILDSGEPVFSGDVNYGMGKIEKCTVVLNLNWIYHYELIV